MGFSHIGVILWLVAPSALVAAVIAIFTQAPPDIWPQETCGQWADKIMWANKMSEVVCIDIHVNNTISIFLSFHSVTFEPPHCP